MPQAGITLSSVIVSCQTGWMRDLNEVQVFMAVADRLNFDMASRDLGRRCCRDRRGGRDAPSPDRWSGGADGVRASDV